MLWLYLTAMVILIGGSINAVLQEFTDPDAAEAGAKQAAAKEIIANPDADVKSAADKKAEILPSVVQKEKDDSVAEPKPAVVSSEPAQSSGTKKSPLKLAVGLVVGLVENIFSSKKK